MRPYKCRQFRLPDATIAKILALTETLRPDKPVSQTDVLVQAVDVLWTQAGSPRPRREKQPAAKRVVAQQ
jgi:hypothetical protein